MSETEIKKVEGMEEQSNLANKDAAPAEPTHLKNDAEDLGPAVVKPTDGDNQTAAKRLRKCRIKQLKMLRTDPYRVTATLANLLRKKN